jgi:hypothetical protein
MGRQDKPLGRGNASATVIGAHSQRGVGSATQSRLLTRHGGRCTCREWMVTFVIAGGRAHVIPI